MFSFHKPKVYRSTQGCCICKAKSSSSRFTDSKKYELDFIECFQLDVPRQGEICNACVLLVKRFKRLPPDSDRNWGHVVDARVGPGLKSMTKFKKRKEEQLLQQQLEQQQQQDELNDKMAMAASVTTKGVVYSGSCSPTSSTTSSDGVVSPHHLSDTEPDPVANLYCHESLSDDLVMPSVAAVTTTTTTIQLTQSVSTTTRQDTMPNVSVVTLNRRIRRKSAQPVKHRRAKQNESPTNAMLASVDWTAVQTCCGLVYEHRHLGAVIVDMVHWRREHCVYHKPAISDPQTKTPDASAPTTGVGEDDRTTPTPVSETATLTIASSVGRKIKLTSNAVQLLKKATVGHVAVAVAASTSAVAMAVSSAPTAPAATTTAVQPNAGGSLLGKIITIKAGSATVVNAVGTGVGLIAADQGHKFNDNSSDSGYDEAMLHEPNGGLKSAPTIMRPLVLPKGIKLHVQSQKLSVSGIGSKMANQIVVLPLTQKLVQVNGKAALYNSAKVSMASATTATPATTTTATTTSSAASAMQTTNTRTRTRNH